MILKEEPMPQRKSSSGSTIANYKVTVTHSTREESPVISQMRGQILAKIAVDSAIRKKLAEFLRLRRLELGLTQKQAGKLAEPQIDGGNIARIERTGWIGHDLLFRYTKALGCKVPEDLIPVKKNLRTHDAQMKEGRIRSKKLGQFLAKRRKELGLSRVDVANALDIHWTPVYQWERALRSISDFYLNAWAEVLKCDPTELKALALSEEKVIARVVLMKREDSEFLDFLLKLNGDPYSSRVVKESCKFLYSFLLMKALKQQSLNPHLFEK
jgi:transcriptional regulator with XRE-family HTH domain